MAELKANGITFSYRETATVDGVTLALAPGEFIGILGVNGSGKSTLLNCLDDLLRPQTGDVTIDGEPLAALAPRDRATKIAYVTQHSHANRSTVYETLLLGRKPYISGAPKEADYAKVEQVIADFGLEGLAHRFVDELSGGEYQKMVIARAFVQDTPVLLLDEPTNNLDPANQIEVLSAVRDAAHTKGVAVAAVMHDINLALAFCDRIVGLKSGRLLAEVPVDEITAEFMSELYDVEFDLPDVNGRKFAVVRTDALQEADAEDAEVEAKAEAAEATASADAAEAAKAGTVEVTSAETQNGENTCWPAASCMSGASFGDVAAYFDERAESWDESCTLRRSTTRRIDELLPDLAGAKVIDVACGTGVMIPYYLDRWVEQVTAIDISPKMAAIAAEKFARDVRVDVRCGDILDANLPCADAVVIYNAYPHFPNKDALVRKVYDLLVPGGVCLVAHSMGREHLNGHHGAQAAGVSVALRPAYEEAHAWKDRFEVTALIDEEDFYALRLRKPENSSLRSGDDSL